MIAKHVSMIGHRVRRGATWNYQESLDTDEHGHPVLGTVIWNMPDLPGWVYVGWDNGQISHYHSEDLDVID